MNTLHENIILSLLLPDVTLPKTAAQLEPINKWLFAEAGKMGRFIITESNMDEFEFLMKRWDEIHTLYSSLKIQLER